MVKLHTSTYAITGEQWLHLAIISISATLWYYPVSFCHTMVLSCFFQPHYGIILFLSATLWYYHVSFCHTTVLSCFFQPHYGIILFLSATLWYYPVSALQVTCTLFSLQTTTKKRTVGDTCAWDKKDNSLVI